MKTTQNVAFGVEGIGSMYHPHPSLNGAVDRVWQTICDQTHSQAASEPILASMLHATILNHQTLERALSYLLASKLDSPAVSGMLIREVVDEAVAGDASMGASVRCDLEAISDRDSACDSVAAAFLYYKGFHALQSYRVAHWLWTHERKALALYLQNRISVVFGVDIHPAARLGHGIMLDHATGIVIGETTVVGNNVSIMQSVTLGGTGKEAGDRHPKVQDDVLISAGAKILGNITIGRGAKVGAGSVVLKPVPPHTTVAGVPAKILGRTPSAQPAKEMCHQLTCKDEL